MEVFNLWRDYLGLASVVGALQKEELEPQLAGTEPGLDSGPKLRQDLLLRRNSLCTFCKHNGESRNIYLSHMLKDEEGRVVCSILRKYVCPQCRATQDNAHTKRFCPLTSKGSISEYSYTPHNSAGKRATPRRPLEELNLTKTKTKKLPIILEGKTPSRVLEESKAGSGTCSKASRTAFLTPQP